MIPRSISKIAAGIIDLFLPNLCLLCADSLLEEGSYVCPGCWNSLMVFPDRSGLPFRSLRGVLERLWIGWAYDEHMKKIIHLLKYDRRPEVAGILVREWLKTVPQMEALQDMDCLLPVPIHAARRRYRGFNQSERLAQHMGAALGRPVLTEGTVRVINTPSQTELGRDERWRSVAGAFQVPRRELIATRRVLIIDDLATSGATLHALGSLLREAGARSISAAVMTSPEIGDSQLQKSA